MSPHPDALRSYAYALDGRVRCFCSCGWVSRLTKDIGRACDAWAAHDCGEGT